MPVFRLLRNLEPSRKGNPRPELPQGLQAALRLEAWGSAVLSFILRCGRLLGASWALKVWRAWQTEGNVSVKWESEQAAALS